MRSLSLFIFLLLSVIAEGQDLTGSWYGKANVNLTGSNNNYLTEMIIKQKGDDIEGIFGYYFRNGYKSIFIRGTLDRKTRTLRISNIPLTYFRSSTIDGVDCPMDFIGTIISSRKETTIKGLFTPSSRLYAHTCPDVTLNYTLDIEEANQDSIIGNRVAQKLWSPRPEDIIVNDVVVKDTVKSVVTAPVVDTASKRNFVMDKLIESFNKRKTIYAREIEISSDSVRVSFYDNGDIDGDSISVFLNKVPVVTQQPITAQALNIYIKLDPTKEYNELSMYAENLGRFPPNTALMVIYDGEQRHELYLSSSLTQNASVRLKRKK